MYMKRYQPARRPVASGIAALTLSALTMGLFVLAPAAMEPESAQAATAGASRATNETRLAAQRNYVDATAR
jgi:hypothetical protein